MDTRGDVPLPRVSDDVRSKIEAEIASGLARHPKLSGPGPLGSRFEHWGVLALRDDAAASAGTVLTRWLLGEAPPEALSTHTSGRALALKPKEMSDL
jgi:hypothetical protein